MPPTTLAPVLATVFDISRTAAAMSAAGVALFAIAALATRREFVEARDERLWVIVFRELSFGGAGWILAAGAMAHARGHGARTVKRVGVVLITATVIFFGVEHFLHPTGLPGVPLPKQMPAWLPGRVLIDYITGAALLATGGSVLLARNARTVTACLGVWLLLMVLIIYGPVLLAALSDPGIGIQLEGINYFADTLLFTGTILALASTTEPRHSV